MDSILCANTHRDVTTFEVDGMVSNIKSRISQGCNMTFPRKTIFFEL